MKLVKGAGAPNEGACWMSAVNWYAYAGTEGFSWSDHPDCVDPTIRELAILLNDSLEDGEREAMIGPHLFAPVGTLVSEELTRRRAYVCADRAARKWAPVALDAVGLHNHAERLRSLPEIVDKETAVMARDAAGVAAMVAARDAARAAARDAAGAARAAAGAARAAAGAAPTFDANAEILQLILDLCAMGTVAEKPAKTEAETLAFISAGCRT